MTSADKWKIAKRLLDEALDRESHERAAFLDDNCQDTEVRRDVEAMLRAHDSPSTFLEQPAVAEVADLIVGDRERHSIPGHIGTYKIKKLIGRGGMGEVFLAEDLRLHRDVAVKLLPPDLAADADRLRRFEQEAFAASRLNHPNILTIFEFGDHGGMSYIVTEYVDGKNLRQKIKEGGSSVGETIAVIEQIATALSTAHAAGIIHRDIKPDNVMVRSDGLVKVLDFGLAKLDPTLSPFASGEADQDGETQRLETRSGMILGTASYMSPEQVRGRRVDARTDIFSLGVVMYEALAGVQPFTGESVSDIIAAILTTEPAPIDTVDPNIHPRLADIIAIALAKSPEDRYQTATEFLIDLRHAKQILDTGAVLEPISKRLHARDGTRAIAVAGTRPEAISSRFRWLAASAVVLLVMLAAGVGYWAYTRSNTREITSIAVMPFTDKAADGQLDYLTDGLAETLIGSLSQVPDLKVKARSAVTKYKDKDPDVRMIGSDLGVQAVLTGRITRHDDQLIFNVSLTDAVTENSIWNGSYERKEVDAVTLEREIVRDVTKKLRGTLSGTDEKRLARNMTDNPDAYRLYLQGLFHWDKLNEAGYKEAIDDYNRAVELDPNFVLGYAGLANAYVALGVDYWRPRDAFPLAKVYAQKALDLSPDLAEAHAALASVKFYYEWDWDGAHEETQRAVAQKVEAMEPFACTLHYLDSTGKADEAVSQIRKLAAEHPTSIVLNGEIGCSSYYAHRYDQSIAESLKTIEMDPDSFPPYYNLGRAYGQKRMYREAVAELIKAKVLSGGTPYVIAELAYVHAVSGNRSEALELLQSLQKEAMSRYIDAYLMAVVYSGMGDKEKALASLEKAFTNHSTWLIWAGVEPKFDFLHKDQRYVELLRRVNLPA